MIAPISRLCAFRVADLWFGVDAHHVQELLRPQPVTRVPLAPAEVVGLMNLRGQIAVAIDVRIVLGLRTRDGGEPHMNVVVRERDHLVALVVDRIDDVFEVDPALLEPLPGSPRAIDTTALRFGGADGRAQVPAIVALYKLPDRLCHVIDVSRLLAVGGSS